MKNLKTCLCKIIKVNKKEEFVKKRQGYSLNYCQIIKLKIR
jgi:hypothetical protein